MPFGNSCRHQPPGAARSAFAHGPAGTTWADYGLTDRARAPPGRLQPRRQRGPGPGADGRPRAHPPDPPIRGRRGWSSQRDPLDHPDEGALLGGPRSC